MVSPVPASPARAARDSCPGALTVHHAADGGLARVRLPGGVVSGSALRALAGACRQLGDGSLELTSRGNVQIRGLCDGAEIALAGRLFSAGLLPSLSHERVRNIVASPLTGLDGAGRVDVSSLVAGLDEALCARARLADLPGRFLFALDDGRGDVASLDADVRVVAIDGERALLQPGGFSIALRDSVEAMLAVAEAFLDELAAGELAAGELAAGAVAAGPVAWRIAELPDGGRALVERLDLGPRGPAERPAADRPPARAEPAGLIEQAGGGHALVALAPLGRLTAAQAGLLADLAGPRGLRVTPWRSIVLADAPASAADQIDRAGLGIGAGSPWYQVSTCTGRPGCAKALADVQSDARAQLDRFAGRRVRWSGCARRCGRPRDTEVDIVATVATSAGYEVVGG